MTPVSDDWRPSCTTQMLHVRAEMLRSIRDLFWHHDYLEVETPCLSRDIVLDASVEPFALDVRGTRWFLQTSPEAHMKRLLAWGRSFNSVVCSDSWNVAISTILNLR